MTDKTELHEEHDVKKKSPDYDANRQAETEEQDIFEQRFHELMNEFGKQCEKHGLPVAIAIAMYPTPINTNQEEAERFSQPMVFFRGDILESMSLAAEVLRNFKTGLSESLDTNPR